MCTLVANLIVTYVFNQAYDCVPEKQVHADDDEGYGDSQSLSY